MIAAKHPSSMPPTESVHQPLLIGVKEAAKRLGIGRDSCYLLVREGRLRSVAVGSRRLIPTAELEAFASRELGGDASGTATPAGQESAGVQ